MSQFSRPTPSPRGPFLLLMTAPAILRYHLDFAWIRRYWLTLLLAIAFVMSTLLTIEQNRVITAQNALIQSLYFDSASLVALKAKQAREHRK
jgi:hypothetical protein